MPFRGLSGGYGDAKVGPKPKNVALTIPRRPDRGKTAVTLRRKHVQTVSTVPQVPLSTNFPVLVEPNEFPISFGGSSTDQQDDY